MSQNLVRRVLTVAAFATVLAVPAAAQSFGFGFGVGGHSRHHGGVGFGIGFRSAPVYAPVYAPAYAPVATGHYEVVTRQVWVEGCERRVWVNPVTEVRFDRFGVAYTAEVRCGYWTVVRDAGHYETRTEQVWVSGC